MVKQELTNDQKIELDETLKRAGRLEALIHMEGWEDIKSYYANKVQALASGLLLDEKTEIGKFESERQRLMGIRQLFTMIDSDMETLIEFRKQEDAKKVTGVTEK
jgi:hypothetical protein